MLCVYLIIVSVTKFSIVIGPPRAYLSRNRRAITWVSIYRCILVIGYPRDSQVNYALFISMFRTVFKLTKSATDEFAQKKIFNRHFEFRNLL